MTPEKLGSLVGGVFGLIFVLANTASVPDELAWLLRGLGVAAFVAVLVAIRRPSRAGSGRRPRGGFGLGYWLIVAAEGASRAGLRHG